MEDNFVSSFLKYMYNQSKNKSLKSVLAKEDVWPQAIDTILVLPITAETRLGVG